MELRDRWVHFRIRDVYYPDPAQVLIELHDNDVLLGKVIDLSDSGMQAEAFAVIEIERIKQAVIVPVEWLLGIV